MTDETTDVQGGGDLILNDLVPALDDAGGAPGDDQGADDTSAAPVDEGVVDAAAPRVLC